MPSPKYVPDARGLHELGASPQMQAAMLDVARQGAAAAQSADRQGRYVVEPQAVVEGFRNEIRAGAVITDEGPDSMGRESTRHTLTRVAIPAMEG